MLTSQIFILMKMTSMLTQFIVTFDFHTKDLKKFLNKDSDHKLKRKFTND